MIGGLVRDRLPVYATTADPVKAHALGFKGAKIPLPYGPADGKVGMDKNIETVARWRAALPADFPLMIDCYMSLTVPYTIELARRLADIDVNWIEEMLHPDDYDGYAELRRQITSTKLTVRFGAWNRVDAWRCLLLVFTYDRYPRGGSGAPAGGRARVLAVRNAEAPPGPIGRRSPTRPSVCVCVCVCVCVRDKVGVALQIVRP